MTMRPALLVLFVGSLCGLVGVLVLPKLPADPAEQLLSIAAQGPRFLAGNALTFGSAALLMLGFGQLAAYFRRLYLRIPAICAATAAVGWFLHTSLIAVHTVTYELARAPEPAAMAAIATALYAGPVFLGILIPMLLTTLVGMIGTAVSMWRTGSAPVWILPVVVLAIVSDFIAPEQFSGMPMFVLLAVGFGILALRRSTPSLNQPRSRDVTTSAATSSR